MCNECTFLLNDSVGVLGGVSDKCGSVVVSLTSGNSDMCGRWFLILWELEVNMVVTCSFVSLILHFLKCYPMSSGQT
jgi:hypothetical protein